MNYKLMGRILSQIMRIEAVFMIPALIISMYIKNTSAVLGFSVTIEVVLVLSIIIQWICRNAETRFYAREGLVSVSISWIFISLIGSLPFWISGEIPSFIDAVFETASGFTTTGASILSNVEGMSKGMLYWRSFTHWLGGMGVLVFLLAIVSTSEENSGFTMHILRAESPGPNVGKLVPRMKKTAGILYVIYIALTIINMLFLLAGGMSVFESVCTAFGTAGTGGFGVKNDSIAGYSPYIQNVCTVFMLLFGINFSCYYLLLLRKFKEVFKDEELKMYVGIIVGSIIFITINIRNFYPTLGETVRHAAFQVASMITTTGFATTDFDLWPAFSKAILVFLMIMGACAGSTGGGFECGRALIIFKSVRRNIRQVINPRKVQVVRNNGQRISEKVIENTNAYLAAYVFLMLISYIVISIDGFSMTTNATAVIACFNNIGPGMDAVGPTCNFSMFSPLSKLVLIMDMIAGRLEIFPVLILASRSTWGKK